MLGHSKRFHRCTLESLEDRNLLTVIYDSLYPSTLIVPQDSDGVRAWWSDVDSFGQPEHGTLVEDSGQLTYVPDPGYIGDDQFTLVDHRGQSQTRDVIVSETIYAVPDWARVTPDGGAQRIGAIDNDYVLNSPTDWIYWQLQDGGLRIVDVTTAEHGELVISENGLALEFSPATGFTGTEVVEYTVMDSAGHTSSALVTIEVSSDPVLETRFTSEAEFLHDRIDAWMRSYAHSLHDWNWSRAELFGGLVPFIGETTIATADARGQITNTTGEGDVSIGEGDIVRRFGDFLLVATENRVAFLDLTNPEDPVLMNSIRFDGTVQELFISDDRLTVVSERWSEQAASHETRVNLIDISDPLHPMRVASTKVEAGYVDSRLIDDNLYLVSSLQDQLPRPGTLVNQETTTIVSPSIFVEQLVDLGASALVPSLTASNAAAQTTEPIYDITAVDRAAIEGPGTLVTTLDVDGDSGFPKDMDLVAIHGGFSKPTVHFAPEAIYIAGSTGDERLPNPDFWIGGVRPIFTQSTNMGSIAKLTIEADGSGVEMAAAGELEGALLDQFSLDEHDGRLRVAVTRDWDKVDVHVFEQVGDSLEIVGSLQDIAPAEQIYSARFDGDQAFVVTFRLVDPLFVIDLSDPTAPTIQGELKLPGFSNYLHVVSDDYVIGVGRGANENTGMFEELQVSLFNVSDPSNPTLVDRYSFEGGRNTWSTLVDSVRNLGDHQAFTYIDETGILALPFHTNTIRWLGQPDSPELESGIRFFQIDTTTGITELGTVEFDSQALRSLRFDDYMVLMSETELKVTAHDSPNQVFSEIDLTQPQQQMAVGKLTAAHQFDPKTDLDGDGVNSPLDALALINRFNTMGSGTIESLQVGMSDEEAAELRKLDINGDGIFNPVDAVLVVNSLHNQPQQMPFAPQDVGDDDDAQRANQVDAIFAEV